MITECPDCNARYQILRSDLYEGPMCARCGECSLVFPLNDQRCDTEIRPLTLPARVLIRLDDDEDTSRLDLGPEWVGDELIGPLALPATEPPPVVRMTTPRFGALGASQAPWMDAEARPNRPKNHPAEAGWKRALQWLGRSLSPS